MKLKFKNEYLSITAFQDYELPDFTLITGINGSGKTHLLGALSNPSLIEVKGHNNNGKALYFDWNTLKPNPQKRAKPTVTPDSDQIIQSISNLYKNAKSKIITDLNRTLNIPHNISEDILSTSLIPVNLLDKEKQISSIIKSSYASNASQARVSLSANPLISNASNLSDYDVLKLKKSDLENLPMSFHSKNSIFEEEFEVIFMRYYELVIENKLNKLDFNEGEKDSIYLSDEDFEKKHGRPPWDVVNGIIKTANLKFQVTYPKGNNVKTFKPKLIDVMTGKEVVFNQLSSGEQILISFAFCVFNVTDKRISYNKPKLLLLDEVDATLHPAMSKQLIKIIQEDLIKTEGIKVIMSTHSPSTVAVSPESSIFVKHPRNPTLKKTSRNDALSILTSGVPTLAIDFEGRKQVFVESDEDAKRYDAIYQMYKSEFKSEISLTFIGVGLKNSRGSIGSGCKLVEKTVSGLRDAGNKNIFGLLDWDLETSRSDTTGIKILGDEHWYAIENCLCDPLLVALSVLNLDSTYLSRFFDVDKSIRYTTLLDHSQEEIQNLVNCIQSKVLDCNIEELKYDQKEFTYKGGLTLKVSDRYSQYKSGHDLTDKIISTFQSLGRYERNPDGYLMYIIDEILKDHLNAAPNPLLDTYRKFVS